MREIKFRAWDDFQEEMLYGDKFLIDFYGQPHEGTLTGWVDEEQDEMLRRREVKLMQFTGLKDNNGKEIWEGDIVRCTEQEYDINGEVYQVKWHGENYPAFDIDGFEGESNGLSHFNACGSIEVIGNIYENPELLKETK